MITKTMDEYTVTYDDSPETQKAVFDRVVQFFLKEESFTGEQIYQSDIVASASPEFLTELAEGILKFKVKWN